MPHNDYYCKQKFMMTANVDDIDLEDYIERCPADTFDWTLERCLFDTDDYIRSISISEMDTNVDTENDFKIIVDKIKRVDCLYLINDRPVINNPVYQSFSELTLKEYIYFFNKYAIKCKIDKGVA